MEEKQDEWTEEYTSLGIVSGKLMRMWMDSNSGEGVFERGAATPTRAGGAQDLNNISDRAGARELT